MEADRQRAGVYTNNAAQFRLMSNIEKYRVENRPDYVPLTQMGNSETQRRFREQQANTLSSDQQYALMGRILEAQRQEADKTPGLIDDRYFGSELEQWGQNASEMSAAQHQLLKNSDIVGSNYLETRGDLAVEFLKGRPTKPSEFFSPISGDLAKYLPAGGMGVQQYNWDRAIAYDRGLPTPGAVSFMGAVERVGSARGSLFEPSFDTTTTPSSLSASESAILTQINAVPAVQSVQTEIIPPTGEIDVFGNKFVIPGLAFFQQPTTKQTTTFTQKTETTPFALAFGENFSFKLATSMDTFDTAPWVPSKGEVAVGAPVYSMPVAVGLPIITTRFNPSTGMTETVSEQMYNQDVSQKYETWDMSKQTVTPITTTFTPGKSAFDVMISPVTTPLERANVKIRSYLPPIEQGEAAMRTAGLFNPFTIVPTVAAMFTEKFNPEQASNARAIESLVGFRGQYTQFYEQPLLMPTSLALAAGFGGVWRGTTAVSGSMRAATAERVISQGGKWRLAERGGSFLMSAVPKVMVGLYGLSLAERSTSGFTDFNPERAVTKTKGLVMQEAVPMGIGFNLGYNAPGQVVHSAKLAQLDYLSMKQEAQAQNLANIPTMGRAGIGEIKYNPLDYAAFKAQKFGVETQGRVSILGEDILGTYVKAKVTGIPDVQVAAQNALYTTYGKAYQALGYGEYSPSLPKVSEPPGLTVPKTMGEGIPGGITASRMGTKTVGGKEVPGLRSEPSLKSMGVSEKITPSSSGGGRIGGQRLDFRNAPRGAMKPMTNIKQSAILFPQEQMPMMERPQQIPQSLLVTPERVSQPQSFEYDILQVQQLDARQGILTGVIPAFMSTQVLGQRQNQEMMQSQTPMRIQEASQLSQFTQVMRNIQRQDTALISKQGRVDDQIYASIQTQMPGLVSGQKSWQDVVSVQSQMTRSTQIQTPRIDTTWGKITTPIPIIPILPSFGGYGMGGGPRGRRRARNITPWGLDIATFGRTRPTLARQGTYGVPRMPVFQMPKLPRWRWMR